MKASKWFLAVIGVMFLTVGSAWSAVSLPTANISGQVQTTAGTGVGSLTLANVVVSRINYVDGAYTTVNTAGESIIGKTVTISGATRTGDFTFTDAVLTVSDGSFNYFSAILSNITLITDGFNWYLNPGLDANNVSTLNLTNVVLSTDGTHPSRFINELSAQLGTGSVLGMKMIISVISGSINETSTSNFIDGVIDGVPPAATSGPSGARTIGYWKNHDEERNSFINSAMTICSVFSSANELNYYLSLKGKKPMIEKAKQQHAALCLNLASSLPMVTVLDSGELNIIQHIDSGYTTGATVGDAFYEIEDVINLNDAANMEHAKDLADEINNRDND